MPEGTVGHVEGYGVPTGVALGEGEGDTLVDGEGGVVIALQSDAFVVHIAPKPTNLLQQNISVLLQVFGYFTPLLQVREVGTELAVGFGVGVPQAPFIQICGSVQVTPVVPHGCPAGAVDEHVPLIQFGVVPVHVFPQEPQFLGSVETFVHVPLHIVFGKLHAGGVVVTVHPAHVPPV